MTDKGQKPAKTTEGKSVKKETKKRRVTPVRIVKTHPIPQKRGGRTKLYDFENMVPGDSFAIPRVEAPNVRPLASYYKKKMNAILEAKGEKPTVNFTSETVGDKVRFWRTS